MTPREMIVGIIQEGIYRDEGSGTIADAILRALAALEPSTRMMLAALDVLDKEGWAPPRPTGFCSSTRGAVKAALRAMAEER